MKRLIAVAALCAAGGAWADVGPIHDLGNGFTLQWFDRAEHAPCTSFNASVGGDYGTCQFEVVHGGAPFRFAGLSADVHSLDSGCLFPIPGVPPGHETLYFTGSLGGTSQYSTSGDVACKYGPVPFGFGAVVVDSLIVRGAWFSFIDFGDLQLAPAVPEPATYALLIAGLVVVCVRHRALKPAPACQSPAGCS